MDTLPTIDYAGAVVMYTPFVVAVCQAMKQSPKVDNGKLPYYAIIIGIIVAMAMAVVSGKIVWTPSVIVVDPGAVLKAILEGTVGGGAGPAVYSLQRGLPVTLLPPGPDNYPKVVTGNQTQVAQSPATQSPPPPPVVQ